MRKYSMLWMAVGCILPLLVILMLPAFGIKGDITTFIFIILMFACHLFMMKGHGHDSSDEHHESKNQKRGEQH